MLPKFRSFVRSFIVPIHRSSFVHSPYSSFFQIIFVLPLCCRNSDRSFVRSFVCSFIVPIHRSPFIHRHYSSFIVRSYELFIVTIYSYYSSTLFTIVTIYRHYSLSLLFIVTIRHHCYSSMISMVTFLLSLFIVAIHRSTDHLEFQLLIHHVVQST
jgi:hypothetical protein